VAEERKPWTHAITLAPATRDGYRGWWRVSVDAEQQGLGRTVDEALCDLIDTLKTDLDRWVSSA
jgi:hypothetical protein